MCCGGAKDDYEITEGEVLFYGENVLEMEPEERAAVGLFLAMQYPIEIPGVSNMTFLKTALNAQRTAREEGEISTPDFIKKIKELSGKIECQPGNAASSSQCRLLRW